MATYKISGSINEEAVVYIIQNEEYKGKRKVEPGSYQIIFESHSDSPVIAVAENKQGQIMSFGNITILDAQGESPNISTPPSISDIIEKLSTIQDILIQYYDLPEEITVGINEVLDDLKDITQ